MKSKNPICYGHVPVDKLPTAGESLTHRHTISRSRITLICIRIRSQTIQRLRTGRDIKNTNATDSAIRLGERFPRNWLWKATWCLSDTFCTSPNIKGRLAVRYTHTRCFRINMSNRIERLFSVRSSGITFVDSSGLICEIAKKNLSRWNNDK